MKLHQHLTTVVLAAVMLLVVTSPSFAAQGGETSFRSTSWTWVRERLEALWARIGVQAETGGAAVSPPPIGMVAEPYGVAIVAPIGMEMEPGGLAVPPPQPIGMEMELDG